MSVVIPQSLIQLRVSILRLFGRNKGSGFNIPTQIELILNSPKSIIESQLKSDLLKIKDIWNQNWLKTSPIIDIDSWISLYSQVAGFSIFILLQRWIQDHSQSELQMIPFRFLTSIDNLSEHYLLKSLFPHYFFEPQSLFWKKCFEILENRCNLIIKNERNLDFSGIYGLFYSEYLTQLTSSGSRKRGIIHTPQEIIQFIIRSTDYLLQNHHWNIDNSLKELVNGVKDPVVYFLDPAAGALNFTIEASNYTQMSNTFTNSYAFELDPTSYLIAVIRLQTDKTNKFDDIQISNHFIFSNVLQENLPVSQDVNKLWIVWGNPPYSIVSTNISPWIMQLSDEYINPNLLQRTLDKPPIKRIRGLKGMKDDTVKFYRWAQWWISDRMNQGIVSFISNGFFLAGMAARGMRYLLRQAFDEIYVIQLFGGKEEQIPAYLKERGITIDENIFGNACSRSIAIVFLICYPTELHKKNKLNDNLQCSVKYTEIAGSQLNKLTWLGKTSFESISWIDVGYRLDLELIPSSVTEINHPEYNSFPYLVDLFYQSAQGIVTAHDTLVTDYEIPALQRKLRQFFDGSFAKQEFMDKRGYRRYNSNGIVYSDNQDWKIEEARHNSTFDRAVHQIQFWQFRGFDCRYLTYDASLLHRPRFELMQCMLPAQENVALIMPRDSRGLARETASSIILTSHIVSNFCAEGGNGLASYIFPLRINLSQVRKHHPNNRYADISNINRSLFSYLPYPVIDEDIFYYLYGILFTPQYRQIYKSLRAEDFPRIPFPLIGIHFYSISQLGRQLARLHLLLPHPIQSQFNLKSALGELFFSQKIINSPESATNGFSSLSLDDCPINIGIPFEIDEIDHKQIHGHRIYDVVFEGDLINTVTKKSKPDSDPSGNLVPYRIFFAHPPPDKENVVFWIGGITRPIWEFEIGAYRQIATWLNMRRYSPPTKPKKDRLCHGLRDSPEELQYLRFMVSAIKHTLPIQEKLNTIFKTINGQWIIFSVDQQLILKKGAQSFVPPPLQINRST